MEALIWCSLGDEFWSGLVCACSATILSSIHNEFCDAYLLSSPPYLFGAITSFLITCGQTKLVDSFRGLNQSRITKWHRFYSNVKMSFILKYGNSNFADDVARLSRKGRWSPDQIWR